VLPDAAPSALVRGRDAYARRAWADAHAALLEAEREAPLEVDDVERLARAAGLLARDDEFFLGLERAYEMHRARGDWERAAGCAFWMATRFLHRSEVGRGSAWLARAEELVAEAGEGSVVSGFLLLPAAQRHLAALEFDEAMVAATRARAIAEKFQDRDLVALAESVLGRILLRRGEVPRGLELLGLSMLSASGESVQPSVAGIVYCSAIAQCSRVFALERAREWTQVLKRFCEAQPQLLTFSGTCLVHCSEVQQVCGDWPAALRDAERACERAPEPSAPGSGPLGHALYQRAELKRVSGDFSAAEELYRAASDAGRDPQPGLALLRLAQGKRDAALVAIRRVLSATVDPQARIALLPAGVEISLRVGAIDEARALTRELEEAAGRYQLDVLCAMAAHARGSLSLAEDEPEAAFSPLRTAFEIWQRVGAPYLGARVRVELAAACRALGDVDGAELECRSARTTFEKLGARHDLACLAEAERKQAPGGLTPRELGVLRLVASGKTNKAIAAELSLSEKTVDRHLSNIFSKLNVNSRSAATAYAYQHGLA
jgi:DNA-binding NarL/FixJ family response regulator